MENMENWKSWYVKNLIPSHVFHRKLILNSFYA